MSELFVPAEFAAMSMAFAAAVLGVLFAFPKTFRLRSPGIRVAGLRLLVGSILAVDATLQFLPGAPPQVAYLLVVGAGQEPPALSWWFSYWAGVIAADPGFWWYGTGILLALLAACTTLGVARRLAYAVGFLFSLMLGRFRTDSAAPTPLPTPTSARACCTPSSFWPSSRWIRYRARLDWRAIPPSSADGRHGESSVVRRFVG